MAMSGALVADFSSFTAACATAEANLRALGLTSTGVGGQLNQMVTKFSGTKVIDEALMMAEAVDRVGGISKLTTANIRDVGATAAEAGEQLKRFGVEVPPRIQALADAFADVNNKTEAAIPSANNLRTSLSAFDGVLSSMGINLSGQIRGLNDLADASGKTVGQLGAIATAGLAVGAGVAGWKIGTAISDFFALDVAIGNATAKLLGFGDVVGEEAAAKTDLLARASKIAGFEVETLATAMTIMAAAGKDQAGAVVLAADAAKQLAKDTAAAEVEQRLAAQAITDRNARILREMGAQIAARKEAEKIEAASILATTKLWDEYYALQVSHGGTTNEIQIAQINRWAADAEAAAIKAGTATKAFYEALAALSKEKTDAIGIDWKTIETKSIEALQETARNARKTYDEMIFGANHFTREALAEQLAKTREAEAAARGMGRGYVEAYEAAQAAAQALADQQKKMRDEERKAQLESRALGGSFEITRENFAASARGLGQDPGLIEILLRRGYSFQQALLWARHPEWPPPEHPGPRVPGFAAGVENFAGGLAMVGERGPELVSLPSGSSVIPFGRGGGTVINNVHLHVGAVGSEQQIARIVQKAMVDLARAQGKRLGN